jgi:drug/metabolite transporter (DMT)-like permease
MTALNRVGQATEEPDVRQSAGERRAWLGRAGFALVFVAVWSSGFLVGSIGTRTVAPGTLGFWRFLTASAVLGVIAVAGRGRWPRRPATWIHLIVSGILLQTCQFVGVFVALDLWVSAGITSLITDATPLVVAAAAVPLFGERLRSGQVVGLVLGFSGVTAAVSSDLAGFGTAAGILAAVAGLAGSAGGTLYQKRFGDDMDLRTGMFIQMLAATASIIPFTAVSGGFALPLTFAAISSVAWLALIGSIAAFVLLFYVLKRQPGASATSYLFLVPPVTALAGVPVLGQHLTPAAIAGFALAAIGVALVTRRPRESARKHLESSPHCRKPGRSGN